MWKFLLVTKSFRHFQVEACPIIQKQFKNPSEIFHPPLSWERVFLDCYTKACIKRKSAHGFSC